MPTNPIVKTLDVFKDGLSGLLPRLKGAPLDTRALERAEEALHRGVVIAVPAATPTPDHSQVGSSSQIAGSCVRAALIGMQEHLTGR
jgi:hypothetical protein